MNIKSLLLGSAAAVVAATGAQAADAIIAPEPEAVEYVRVCDAYGAGYFYIPGTETCLRIGGYVRYDIKGGDDAYTGGKRGGWDKHARFMLSTQTATETELGTLRTYTESRFNWTDDSSENSGRNPDHSYSEEGREDVLEYAYIDLGGFRVGLAKTKFKDGLGLGNVLNDDVIKDGAFTRTGQIAYTFAGSNGFAASIAVEQGANGYGINDYTPHVVGSATFTQGWGQLGAAVAYDSVIKDWSGKVRASVNVTDQFAVWVMGGFSGDRTDKQAYGAWGGKWAVWGGASYQATEKASLNIQAATEDWGKTSVTANVGYELVSGFKVTPEVTWTRFKQNGHYSSTQKDSVQGMLRFQRSF